MSANSLDSPTQKGTLADAINAATRAQHTKLNRLILARMPLALPPHAVDPTIYLSGLLHIAPIYMAFEGLWRDIVEHRVPASDESFPGRVDVQGNVAAPPVSDRIHSILASLYIPGLVRSDRMLADIASLTGSSPQDVEERLLSVSRTGHLAAFVDHIRRIISRKPHVLVAYTYILFMALFAGGRYIRATFEKPGLLFWGSLSDMGKLSLLAPELGAIPRAPTEHHHQAHHHRHHLHHHHNQESTSDETPGSDSESRTLPVMPVRFLHFNTPADGEDLKCEYKQKLSESEALLTRDEKEDIVQEGICIFENMILVIHQLDAVCAAQDPAAAERWSLVGLMKNAHVVGDRFRDSIAVTRQRWEKSSAQESVSDDDEAGPDVAKAGFHPTKGSGAPGLSPAASKSVRFDGASPHPARCLRGAPRQMQDAHVAKWLLATVLGILGLGLFFTGRRSLLDWLRV
ncbi:heme oxygenase domain-containing protein [Hirsutella rhossiliensis]|uniref:Heme oxygenase domain-containing protein n=1 Tax=Hirsutella rhossiliensis TaxID=111463 RepID=A0A9P8SLK1_9HYPO|nr:heme oxygenase domain-containing protein [Hirsutella rhossiliensis]KAH0965241.1 heme oxygenase domain-containing protein [Hirsutella rhossiliensis]